jgi:acyl-CoA thioesterase FadM
MEYIFELPFKVRDYECDLPGVVNNAVYQNYLETYPSGISRTVTADCSRRLRVN